ncbi:MAG: universal stress protein [Candidatus Scalindua rubra]|uniref:Universal stress protein n=1 Tax=Candidatus Scalindua rubra TaxID=1872076 RepID=A0A1E3XG56_9BACT|nr:MAG: universal stress protein [Candidatus Scalindua rubra]
MNVSNKRSKINDAFMNAIFHPTDFSKANEIAFVHALKFALSANSKLDMFHITSESHESHLSDFPSIRQTLERWKVLPEGSTKSQFVDLGLQVKKTIVSDSNTVRFILNYLKRKPTNLIVLATHQRKGTVRWQHKSVAESIGRQSDEMILFVPQGTQGFVSFKNGRIKLRRILIPIDYVTDPQLAVDTASSLAKMLKRRKVTFVLLYVGGKSDVPKVKTNKKKGWICETISCHGNIVNKIVQQENVHSSDLIVMTTQGREGFLDVLRGSTIERVFRNSSCPVLIITEN